jgi:phage portal protein BeeE
MRESFGGEQRGSALILQGMFKVQTLSFSPEQLALDKLPTHAIARIAAAMGVAPMSLGLPDAGKTYSNLGEANRASWGTIQATQELVAETLRYQLLSDFGLDPEKNTPEYDYSEIQEMQESLDAIWRRVGQGFRDGIITRNEGRDLLGFPQDPMGDTYGLALAVRRNRWSARTSRSRRISRSVKKASRRSKPSRSLLRPPTASQ